MRCLDRLKLGYELLLFAGIAIGVVQQGKFAVLLFNVVNGGGGGEFEVGVVIYTHRSVGNLASVRPCRAHCA